MKILVHSTYDATTIATNLGAPEYSYWFVRKAFSPLLTELGHIVPVTDDDDIDVIWRSAEARGEPCVLFAFNPPQYMPLGLSCPVIPVFAWEFDRIPDESWNANPQEDWRIPLGELGCAITHCQSAVDAVRHTMGQDYPIWSIPAPVHSRNSHRRGTAKGWQDGAEITLAGCVAISIGAIDLALFRPERTADAARALHVLRRSLLDPNRLPQTLSLRGVVYTAVFNPADGRKNWFDLTAGFIWAFRHDHDAVLVLKLTYADLHESVQLILEHVSKLGSFTCRIVLIHGMMSDEAYGALIDATSFAVNTSDGEGQCLPLMEYMSAGRPAIAPRHSAMADYVSIDNAFVIASHERPSFWPHDERQATRCLRHEISFADYVRQLRESYGVARHDPDRYAEMSSAASAALELFCGDDVVRSRLRVALENIGIATDPLPIQEAPVAQAEHRSSTPEQPLDSFQLGLHDIMINGWYNKSAGELAPGFPIAADDVVIDVGCGDGGVASFSAGQGAHVILADIDAEKVMAAAARIATLGPRQVDTHVTDADPLPIADGSVTRVVCTEVLEHVDDPAILMRELVRVGKPGALYLISVPGGEHEQLQRDLAPDFYFQKPNHVRIFTSDSFAALIEDAGLVIERRMSTSFFWALWWLFFWQANVPLGAGSHPTLDDWTKTWQGVLRGRDGLRIQQKLDEFMPKVRAIVARKPG